MTIMDQLDSLNYAMDSLTMQTPAVVQRTDSNTTPSTITHIVNLPTMVREQETKASIHSVQLDDQNNKTVPMNSHYCTSQPSPCQQVQEVMSIEHLSTCVHDHTAPNCDQSLLDLHTGVKAQLQVTLATDRQKELPNLNHPHHAHSTPTHIMPQCTLPELCLLHSNYQMADLQIMTYCPYLHKIDWNSKRATYIVKLHDLAEKSKMAFYISPAHRDSSLVTFWAELLRSLSVEIGG